jgi:hypothetical protein
MKKSKLGRWLVLIAVLATITINALANILPINGLNTGEISDRFEIFFVPAGYVFSIWSVIYLGLIAYAIYQVLPSTAENSRLSAIVLPVIISSFANSIWIFMWHYQQFPLTLIFMIALLASLIVTYLRLGTGKTRVSTQEKWLVRIPFSIYLGWVSVATIANVTQVLYFLNWNGFGISPAVWAAVMLFVGAVLAWIMALQRGDIAYLAVFIWAFIGIALKHQSTQLVAVSAWIAVGLVAAAVVAAFLRKKPAA